MKIILIPPANLEAQVSDEDYELLKTEIWYMDSNGYPTAKVTNGCPLRQMHQFILGPTPKGLKADHKDRNPLNNQRENLRFVSHGTNSRNRKGGPNLGISVTMYGYLARIAIDGVRHAKQFPTIEEARAWRKQMFDKANLEITLPTYL